jgi:plasmid replication initiation protein
MNNSIAIETINPKSGKKEWERYTWFSYSKLSEETGVAIMTFSQEFASVILDLKRAYAKINLKDIGELQSKYALRIFELATSYSSLKGKDGNEDQIWYFERSVSDLRLMLGVPENAYPETKHFRQFVVEEPVKEINKAGIGIKITPTACDREVKEYQHLKELYPDEFAGLYAEELASASFMPPESGFRKQAAEAAALCLLREKHGIVK